MSTSRPLTHVQPVLIYINNPVVVAHSLLTRNCISRHAVVSSGCRNSGCPTAGGLQTEETFRKVMVIQQIKASSLPVSPNPANPSVTTSLNIYPNSTGISTFVPLYKYHFRGRSTFWWYATSERSKATTIAS